MAMLIGVTAMIMFLQSSTRACWSLRFGGGVLVGTGSYPVVLEMTILVIVLIIYQYDSFSAIKVRNSQPQNRLRVILMFKVCLHPLPRCFQTANELCYL